MDLVVFVKLELSGGDEYLFTEPSDEIEHDAIPSLDGVSVTPAVIEPGVSIGQRETVTATFADHLHKFDTDEYDAGTFWTKFRARYETIQGAKLTVYRGERGDALSDMEARTYVVDKLQLTKNGATITAKDPLYQLNADSAQVPSPNEGELAADITSADGSLTLFPSGIGDTYPASGRLCIGGSEVVEYTRVGDTCTLTSRGAAGTVAQDHSAGTRVQACLFYQDATPSEIVDDILTKAGLDATLWDASEWTDTDAYVGVTFGTTITEPTSVKKLLDELCEQAALVMWYDPSTAKINLDPLAPVSSGTVVNADNILADTFDVQEQPDKRVSQVWVYYDRADVTKQLDETSNYARVLVDVASNASNYPKQSIKKIFSRWINRRTAAERLAALQIARYSLPPRRFSFDLFHGDGLPSLAEGVSVGHWRLVDSNGAEVQVPAQIVSVQEQGDRTRYVAEEMGFETPIIDPEEEGEVTLYDRDVVGIDALFASAGVHFSPNGKLSLLGTNVSASPAVDADEWFTTGHVPGVGAGYFIRVQVSGTAEPAGSSHPTDVFLSLSTPRYWYIERNTPGTESSTLTVDISTSAGTGGIVATATINLSVIVGL